jgi:hypothetical protein
MILGVQGHEHAEEFGTARRRHSLLPRRNMIVYFGFFPVAVVTNIVIFDAAIFSDSTVESSRCR